MNEMKWEIKEYKPKWYKMKKRMEICNEGKEDILAKTEHSKSGGGN